MGILAVRDFVEEVLCRCLGVREAFNFVKECGRIDYVLEAGSIDDIRRIGILFRNQPKIFSSCLSPSQKKNGVCAKTTYQSLSLLYDFQEVMLQSPGSSQNWELDLLLQPLRTRQNTENP